MALSSETSKQIFVCTGGTVYTVPFYFLQNADLTVYREDADGAVSTLTITTDYTVTGAGSESGGELTTIATYSDGKLIVVRDVDYTQRLDLIQGDGFRPDTLEQELDRIVMQVQQLARKVGVSFQLPDSDTSGASTVLPSPEAGKVFAWNATGDALVNEVPQYTVVGNGSITEPKLADGAVTVEKMADGAVTLDKIDADASTADKGIMRFATSAEAITGTETLAATTPATVNAAYGRLFKAYHEGLVISNSTGDAANDIDISAGICRNADNDGFIQLSTAITKQINAGWEAGTNAGGFPSGLTLTAGTYYRVFLIHDVANGVVDAGFDTDAAAANLLADATGYTEYRQIGWILTDATPKIVKFLHVSDGFYLWDIPVENVNYSTDMPITRTAITVTAPPGTVARLKLGFELQNATGTVYGLICDSRQSDTAPSTTAWNMVMAAGNSEWLRSMCSYDVAVDGSSQIQVRFSGARKYGMATEGFKFLME